MNNKDFSLALLVVALWGANFTVVKLGLDGVPPMLLAALRFVFAVFPAIFFVSRPTVKPIYWITYGLLIGVGMYGTLFYAMTVGMPAGIASVVLQSQAFFTLLLAGLFLKESFSVIHMAGLTIAAIGLYFLSITSEFSISIGDLLVLISAFFWSSHVLLIGWLAPQTNSLKLAAAQFAVCSVFSLITALLIETINFASIWQAIIPILYGGLCSVGIAYTLQIIAQRDAHPAHSAIIMSLEGLFAAIGGWLVLGEVLSMRALLGCTLMLAGMFFSQISGIFGAKKPVS